MRKSVIEFFATWFYLGLSPKAPGTVASLGALPFVFLCSLLLSSIAYMAIVFVFLIFAIFISHEYESFIGVKDSRKIVIDEVAGILITMTLIPWTFMSVVLGFLLFRFFDILKPFPINYIDKKIKGGIGIVADDVLAGIFANFLLQIIYSHTSWLGVGL